MSASRNDPLFSSKALRRRFTSVEAAAVAGIVCAIGWSLSFRGLLAAPGYAASDAEINRYFAEPGRATVMVVWMQVLVFATIAFLWFVGVVRGRVGDREPKLFGTVFFGASILLAGLTFLGGALLAAPAIQVAVGGRAPDPAAASLLRAAAAGVLSIAVPRVATLVMLSTASLGRATGAMPRWLVILTYVIGIVEFVNVTVDSPTIFLVPAWIALVSIVLLVRHPEHAFELDHSERRR